ncbi:MAG: hypothetical protein QXQ39_04105 [Conexivisphaerales archaeon]
MSSLEAEKMFQELREKMCQSALVAVILRGTASDVSAETIQRYIQEQQEYSSTG